MSLAVDGLARRYADAVALDGVTLEVAEGELLAVVGPSGSGKTTLLRIVAGLDEADGGRVVVGGEDVTALPAARRGVAMVFQSYALFPHLDVAANIAFGLRARGVGDAERRARVAEAAELLEVGDLLARRPAQLSGGERQRVALARGLVGRPRLLLLDEPLSSLDAQLRDRARGQLRRLQRERGVTTVVVTHDQAEALTLGDRVAVLDGGRLRQVAPPDEVYERPADTVVARFVGRPPMTLLDERQAEALGLAPRRGALAGVRAEDVVADPEGVPARVELRERAGHEVLAHLVLDRDGDPVRLPARLDAPEGAALRVRATAVRWFDAASGAALQR